MGGHVAGTAGFCVAVPAFYSWSMSEVIDYAKRVEGGMCSIAEWLRDFKDAKCVYIYDKEDRGPWDEVIKNWENFK